MKKLLLMVMLAGFVIACGKDKVTNHYYNTHTEESPILYSPNNNLFVEVKASSSSKSSNGIAIKKEGLGHKFLMRTAIIAGFPTPTGHALHPKIVEFQKTENKIALYESSLGQVNSDSVPMRELLMTFPIVTETDNEIIFDFNSGVKLFYQQNNYYIKDEENPNDFDEVYQVVESALSGIQLKEKHIFLKQDIRLAKKSSETDTMALQVKYVLESYIENESYKAKESNELKKIGFFYTHPTIKAGDGEKKSYIMRFDPSKPINFYVSKNTPFMYVQAIKDGALYWNRAFGKQVIFVYDQEEGTELYTPGKNIIQWIEWDKAGFAYADFQADPLTGETLQANVFMTSVFGVGGLKKAKQIYQKMKLNSHAPDSSTNFSLKGWKSTVTDRPAGIFHAKLALGQAIQTAEKNGTTEEEKEKIFTRFAQDYIREVAAHEVGHVLGLRHNFAGNMASELTEEDYNSVAKIYFTSGVMVPRHLPTSSVMDYTPTMSSAMIGAYIREEKNLKALPYDEAAIRFAYKNEDLDSLDIPPFCSDEKRGTFLDCEVWDQFQNPMVSAKRDLEDYVQDLSYDILNALGFFEEKFDPKKIDNALLKPRVDAQTFAQKRLAPLFKLASSKAQFQTVLDQVGPVVSSYNESEYKKKTISFQKESFQEAGGMATILIKNFSVGEKMVISYVQKLQETFAKNLERVEQGDEQVKEKARQKYAKYITLFERELLFELAELMKKQEFAYKTENLTNQLENFFDKIFFTRKSGPYIVDGQYSATDALYDYQRTVVEKKEKKTQDLRKELASLMTSTFFSSPSFERSMGKIQSKMFKKHDEEMKSIFNGRNEDELDISDELYDWAKTERQRFAPLKKASETYKLPETQGEF